VPQQFIEIGLHGRVHAGGRLIQQQQLRLRDQRPRDEGTLLLAARKLTYLRTGMVQHAHPSQRPLRGFFIGTAVGFEQSRLPVAAHGNHFNYTDREVVVVIAVLGHIPGPAAAFFRRVAQHGHPAAFRLDQAQYNLEQCAFTAAVGADDAQEIMLGHLQVDALQGRRAVIAHTDVLKPYDIHGGYFNASLKADDTSRIFSR